MDSCLTRSIGITLDYFFSTEILEGRSFFIPVEDMEISWSEKSSICVFKYTKCDDAQYLGSDNRPRFTSSGVINLTEFNIVWEAKIRQVD